MMATGTKFRPEVLHFSVRLSSYKNRVVLEIPRQVSIKIKDMPKVEGVINGQPFRAQVDAPDGDGLHTLRVNTAMQRGSKAQIGDEVEVSILGPEPDPIPPEDLQRAFNESPEAYDVWTSLTTLGKHDWIRWIEDAKKLETRMRRVERTIDQLREGKRRACCVDVNSYMLEIVEEDAKERG